jgi:hypothetical protein
VTIKKEFRLAIGIAWIATILLTAGCHKYSLVVQPTVPSILEKKRYSKDDYDADVTAYNNEINGQNDPETVRDLRNKIVYGVMQEIDDAYGQFARRLFSGKADAGVTGDSLVLGLTAASTIATHTPTKTILSALGTAIAGVNLSIDKNFFAQQTFQTIAVAMETRRDKARTQILQSIQDNDAEDYPVEAAMRDLVAYFYAGTLPGGLQELQEQAGSAAQQQSQNPQPAIH